MISSAEEFAQLRASQDSREYMRAVHEPAPDCVWIDVIDRYPPLRKWVAHNKTVSTMILDRLSRDSDPEVRVFVAMKNKLSLELFEKLADDPDYGVRLRIALNRKAPISVLEKLKSDSDPMIAQAASLRHEQKICS